MRPGHYRVYSQPQTSFWCCVGSGLENHAKYGEMIYAHTNDELYVNLFIPSRLTWEEKKTEIIQQNNFPYEDGTEITVNPMKKTSFTIKLRYPDWIEKGTLTVNVNGKPYCINADSDYIDIKRKWKKGDKISVKMPMRITADQLPDKSNYYSFRYGPVVLAAKTNTDDLSGLLADDSRGGHIAHGHREPVKDMPILISAPDKIASNLILVDKANLRFKLNNLLSLKYPAEMELIPFYTLHDSRYIIYWLQATKQDAELLQDKMEAEEKDRLKLDAITVDYVVCGEQQPESDHFIKYDNSRTGYSHDKHWREAGGWFSYQLKNKGGKFLYISFLDLDKSRNFDVYINGTHITTLNLNKENIDPVQSLSFPIPDSELGKELLNIEFKAQSNSRTAKITDVKILSGQYIK